VLTAMIIGVQNMLFVSFKSSKDTFFLDMTGTPLFGLLF
jgi:hypothetical protein